MNGPHARLPWQRNLPGLARAAGRLFTRRAERARRSEPPYARLVTADEAARTYFSAWTDRDPGGRARHLEACFREDGYVVAPGQRLVGRAAVARAIEAFASDPRRLCARLGGAIDAHDTIFRFRAIIEDPQGRIVQELLDVGEVDGAGRIRVVFTFVESHR